MSVEGREQLPTVNPEKPFVLNRVDPKEYADLNGEKGVLVDVEVQDGPRPNCKLVVRRNLKRKLKD